MTDTWDDHSLTMLHSTAHTTNGPLLLALLRTRGPDHVLQQSGDALTTATAQGTPGAAGTASGCAAALRRRGWDGDEVLARQLDAVAAGATPVLRPVPVSLEELAGLLEGDPARGGGRIDLTTGECRPAMLDAQWSGDEDEPEDTGRWLDVPCAGSRDAYRDLQDFTATVDDRDFARYLDTACSVRNGSTADPAPGSPNTDTAPHPQAAEPSRLPGVFRNRRAARRPSSCRNRLAVRPVVMREARALLRPSSGRILHRLAADGWLLPRARRTSSPVRLLSCSG
ncbi:hypothetical protein ACWCZ5_30580 [Streptomyces sp. NPDC001667]